MLRLRPDSAPLTVEHVCWNLSDQISEPVKHA